MNVQDIIDATELATATSINPANMDDELLRMASLYSRFGLLAAKARAQRDSAKSNLELVEAKLDKALRDRFVEKGEKVTENKIRSELVLQTAYIAANKELIEANSVLSVAETSLMALQMKRDMLIQLNKNAEREWAYSSALVGRESAKESVDEAIRSLRRTA